MFATGDAFARHDQDTTADTMPCASETFKFVGKIFLFPTNWSDWRYNS